MAEEFRERETETRRSESGFGSCLGIFIPVSECERLPPSFHGSLEFLSGDEAEPSDASASLYKVTLVSLLTLAHKVEVVEWECLVLSVNSAVNCNRFLN